MRRVSLLIGVAVIAVDRRRRRGATAGGAAAVSGAAQGQRRGRGRAAQCRAHRALCGQSARLLRQALRRRQHHPVRRRRRRHRGHRRRARDRDLQPARLRDRARAQGPPGLGARAALTACLRGARRHQDRRRSQGPPALRRRRRRRPQLAPWPRGAALGRAQGRGRAVHLPGHRGPPARLCRRPDRRRRASSRRCLSGPEAEAGRACAGHDRGSDAEICVQSLRRRRRDDRQGSRLWCATPSPP